MTGSEPHRTGILSHSYETIRTWFGPWDSRGLGRFPLKMKLKAKILKLIGKSSNMQITKLTIRWLIHSNINGNDWRVYKKSEFKLNIFRIFQDKWRNDTQNMGQNFFFLISCPEEIKTGGNFKKNQLVLLKWKKTQSLISNKDKNINLVGELKQ